MEVCVSLGRRSGNSRKLEGIRSSRERILFSPAGLGRLSPGAVHGFRIPVVDLAILGGLTRPVRRQSLVAGCDSGSTGGSLGRRCGGGESSGGRGEGDGSASGDLGLAGGRGAGAVAGRGIGTSG